MVQPFPIPSIDFSTTVLHPSETVLCTLCESLPVPFTGPGKSDESLAAVCGRPGSRSRRGRRRPEQQQLQHGEEEEAAGEEGSRDRGASLPSPVRGLALQVVEVQEPAEMLSSEGLSTSSNLPVASLALNFPPGLSLPREATSGHWFSK